MDNIPGRLGIAFVVSGPSGTGKSSIRERVLENDDNLRFSISCTTREPRGGEVDARDYSFISHAAFEERIKENAFIEYALVHDHYYGTLRSEVEQYVTEGQDVVLDIDVQGAAKIRAAAAMMAAFAAFPAAISRSSVKRAAPTPTMSSSGDCSTPVSSCSTGASTPISSSIPTSTKRLPRPALSSPPNACESAVAPTPIRGSEDSPMPFHGATMSMTVSSSTYTQ